LKIKQGVDPKGLQPEILLAVIVAMGIWDRLGQELVLTALLDGTHMEGSFHYDGMAVDLRTHYFDNATKELAARMLRAALPMYDVVLEATHIHVEADF